MGIRLGDYIDPRLVFIDVDAHNVKDVLSLVVDRIGAVRDDIDPRTLLKHLMQRERSSSTCLECGIAVPHATLEGPEEPFCAVARLSDPYSFGTEKNKVHLLFVLISPPDGLMRHVRILARIARICSLPGFIGRLQAAPDAETVRQVILEEDTRHV